jgi:hypothetical protein
MIGAIRRPGWNQPQRGQQPAAGQRSQGRLLGAVQFYRSVAAPQQDSHNAVTTVDIADGAGVAIDEHGQLPHVQVTVYLTRRQHRTNRVRQFLLGSPTSSAVRVLGSQRSRRDSSTVAATGQAPAPRALAAIA